MATFVALVRFTDQGIRAVKDTAKRADAFVKEAKKSGVDVEEVLWTLGAYDGVLIFEAPDLESATRVMLGLAAKGNVTTQTLPAFRREAIARIVAPSR